MFGGQIGTGPFFKDIGGNGIALTIFALTLIIFFNSGIVIVEINDGEIVKTENWGLINLSYLIKKNKKGSFIHFKIKGKGNVVNELEKNEAIDKKLLRFLTVKVKKFDLETNYFSKKDEGEKRESSKN